MTPRRHSPTGGDPRRSLPSPPPARPRLPARRALATLVAVLPALAGGMAWSSTGAAAATPVSVSIGAPATTGSVMPLLVGMAKGIYRRYGLNVAYQAGLAPSTQLAQVESGQLTFYTVPSEAAPNPALRVFMVYQDRDPWVMVAPDSVKNVKALVGQAVVGQSATSLPNILADQILTSNGVKPTQVSMINVPGGGDPARLALVQAGKAAATVVQYTAYLKLPAGYHKLFTASEFVNADEGIVTTLSYAQSHATVMRHMVAATAAAVKYYTTHEKAALPIMEQKLNLDAATAAKLWRFMRQDFIATRPSAKVIKAALTQDKATLHLSSPPSTSRIFDFAYLPRG